MSAPFTPTWSIASGNLFTVAELEPFEAQLEVTETYVVAAKTGTFQVILGPSAVNVISVSTPNQEIGFTIDPSGQEIVFQPLPFDTLLTITRTPQARFFVLNGDLPPGSSLTSSGFLSGTLTDVQPGAIFAFTIRAQNEFMVRDRAFTITVGGTPATAFFNPATLPATAVEPTTQMTVRDLGSLMIGQSFWYSLDVIQLDFVIPPVVQVPIMGLAETSTLFNQLPPGLELTRDRQILGTIDPETIPGTYLFKIEIADPVSPTSLVFMLTIEDARVTTIDVPMTLDWVTPAGLIGHIPVQLPSPLCVAAVSNRAPITYSLSPFSMALPNGLALNASSGTISGTPTDLTGDNRTVVLRASVGEAFIERSFTIEVAASSLASNSGRAYLQMDAVQTAAETAGISAAIPSSMLFLPDDPSFGVPDQPIISLVNGLGSPDFDLMDLTGKDATAIGNQGFYYLITLITGALKSVSVSDLDGKPLYDVIVRTLHDPNEGAGGYALDGLSNVQEQQVFYSAAGIARPVYINSISNIRYDLVRQLSFNTDDKSLQQNFGPTSAEVLDPWMVDGFALGFPLVYVQYGYGAKALALLAKATNVAPLGDMLMFNTIFVSRDSGLSAVPLQ